MTYTFDKNGAARISRVVRRVERLRPGLLEKNYQDKRPATQILLGKTDAAVTKGSTVTISVYYPDDSTTAQGSESDSTEDLTVYARLGDIDADKWVYCFWIGNGWEIVNAECPAVE